MISKLFCACMLLMVLSCQRTGQTPTDENGTTDLKHVVTEKDIQQLNYVDFSLDDRVIPIVEPWKPFNQLQTIIDNTKKGDISYFKTDGKKNLKTLISDLRKSIPDTLNTSSIIARIRVMETKLFKAESLANLSTTKKQDLLESLKEVLVSYSNLNFQLNKKMENDSQNIERPL